VELGGRLWAIEVDDEDETTLHLSVTVKSDDSKDALREVLAARSHEALERENEALALVADIDRLMERAREVCVCCCVWMGDVFASNGMAVCAASWFFFGDLAVCE
jgi:hypothetical protein